MIKIVLVAMRVLVASLLVTMAMEVVTDSERCLHPICLPGFV